MKLGLAAVGAASLLFVLLADGSAHALDREAIAKKYAPVFHQQVRDTTRDLFAAYDFDGNWAGDDNEENTSCIADASKCAGSPCAGGACKLVGTVYYTVIETTTHWFVQYLPYHPVDTKLTNGHEHDTESVFAVVAKTPDGAGKLLAYETRFHLEWFTYADPSVKPGAKTPNGTFHLDAQGHPEVYVQQVGHGFCGGYAPPNDLFPDLQLTCDHAEAPHLDGAGRTGVVYRPDLPAAMPVVVKGKVVDTGYVLTEIFTTFWARRASIGAGSTFKNAIDFAGERCDVLACPKQFGGAFMGNGGESPSGPWNQEGGAGVAANGDQFFDPAFTMQKRLAFPAPFSLDYCHNPYLSITDKCPPAQGGSATPEPGTAPAPAGSPSVDPTPAAAPASEVELEGASGCAIRSARSGGAHPTFLAAALAAATLMRSRRREQSPAAMMRLPASLV